MSDVFISYSRRDIAFARLIRESLQQCQIDTWIDWERIPVGEKWWPEICEAIQNANVFMFIISQNSIGSAVCKDEINLALQNHKRIIPIIVDPLTPEAIKAFAPDLPQFNWIIFEREHLFQIRENPEIQSDKPEDKQVAFARLPQFVEALEKLNKAIHTDWEWVKYHTRMQVSALLWENNRRNTSYLVRGAALEESEAQLLRGVGKDPQPTGLQVEFVTASRKEETLRQEERLRLERKARVRQRVIIWTVGIGLAAAIVLGGLAWGQRNQYLGETHVRATAQAAAEEQRNLASTARVAAEDQRNVASTAQVVAVDQRNVASTAQVVAEDQRNVAIAQSNIALSRQLAAQAINQIEYKDFSLGLLLSLEAYRHAPTMDAQSSILRLIQTEPQLRFFINGHTDTVWDVAVSPDGKTIASASADGTVGLWDMASGKPTHAALGGHTKGARTVAFSPDGRILASGGDDGQVILWDVGQDYASQALIAKGEMWVYNLAFSPDGNYLAASFTDQSVMVWSMANRSIHCPEINGSTPDQSFIPIAFSRDSQTLAVGSSRSGNLTLWDPATCRQDGGAVDTAKLAKISGIGAGGEVTSLAYSPDGAQLAIGETDHLLVLDAATLQPLREPAVIHNNYRIYSMAYSPDSRILALAMADKTIVLINATTGQLIGQPLIGQRAALRSVVFSSDGHSLVSGGWDANVLVWDLTNNPLSRILTEQATAVAFSPDGKWLASASTTAGHVRLRDTTTWQDSGQTLPDGSQGVEALAFSPDSRWLAAAGADQLVHLWDANSGQPVGEPLSGQGADITCLAFSPDGKWLAAGGADNRLTIWAMANRSVYQSLQFSAPMSANSAYFDLFKTIRSVGYSPDSAILYFSMGAGITRLIDMAGFVTNSPAVRQIQWGQLSSDNNIFSIMSPDARLIALANSMDIRLYDAATLQMVGLPMYGHTAGVSALAFSPDGKLLASTSQDGTVRLWDTTTSQPVGLPFGGISPGGSRPAISPDGKWLASITADLHVVVWDIAVPDWEALACQIVRRNLSGPEWQQFLPDEAYRLTCADQPMAPSGVTQITALARTRKEQGKGAEAKAIIQAGLQWILPLPDDISNNNLCWSGSLEGFAAEVLPACERGVALAPASRVAGNRDSRGLALALSGKTAEAIQDFQFLVDWCQANGCADTAGAQRAAWVTALQQGQNPFDAATLQSLRNP